MIHEHLAVVTAAYTGLTVGYLIWDPTMRYRPPRPHPWRRAALTAAAALAVTVLMYAALVYVPVILQELAVGVWKATP